MRITSESIKVGHPDIVADMIAANLIAEILDEEQKLGVGLQNMPHCGLEVFLGRGLCLVGGEVTTRAKIDVERSVRKTVLGLGYRDAAVGFDGNTMKILDEIIPQSPDINRGTSAALNANQEVGAGDQGIMYGFACDETPELLPLTYVLVSRLMRVFETCGDPVFAPDGKGQVSIEYDEETGRPIRVAKCLMSNAIDYRQVREGGRDGVREKARKLAFDCLGNWADSHTEFLFNPTGEWQAVNSCSAADSGVTGRKLVVQFYGGYPGAQVGGGAVVNKSPEKVDCSAAFGARYVAKNIVASGLAKKCSVQLSYAIGVAKPFSVYVDAFGTGTVSNRVLARITEKLFDLTPGGMIRRFDLLSGDIYRRLPKTFFLDDYLWEKTDMAGEIRQEASACA